MPRSRAESRHLLVALLCSIILKSTPFAFSHTSAPDPSLVIITSEAVSDISLRDFRFAAASKQTDRTDEGLLSNEVMQKHTGKQIVRSAETENTTLVIQQTVDSDLGPALLL